MSDEKFLSKAPPNVIELNKKKLADFNNVLNRTMDELVGKLKKIFDYKGGTEGVTVDERILMMFLNGLLNILKFTTKN